MTDRLPRPLLAAVGALTQVRRVPSTLLTVPLVAFTAFDRARRSYDRLVLRGEQVLERFGEPDATAGPEAAPAGATDRVLDAVSHVPDPLDAPHHPHRDTVPPPLHTDGDEPLPDYDAMTLGALRGSLRALSVEQLEAVLAYERTHQARPPVLTLLEHRLATLALP